MLTRRHFAPSSFASSAPADTAQTTVKPSLLPGLLLAHVHPGPFPRVVSLRLFPPGRRTGHPTPVCPMNIQPKPPCKNA